MPRAFCLVVTLAGAAHAQSGTADFRFSRGDGVRIVVWENPAMSGDFEILSDGRIAHPLLQNVAIADRPFPEVQRDIVRYLEQFQKTPLVVVTPLVRISVGGAVNEPGVVAIDPRAKLIELIGMAGGPSESARLDQVDLVRRGERSQLSLWERGAANETLQSLNLSSGDLVVVPERRSVFRDWVVPLATFLVGVANLIAAMR